MEEKESIGERFRMLHGVTDVPGFSAIQVTDCYSTNVVLQGSQVMGTKQNKTHNLLMHAISR